MPTPGPPPPTPPTATPSTVETALIGTSSDILLITINRPEKRNAIDQATTDLLDAALARLEHEDGVRVGIITGAGGTFCAGTDLSSTAPPQTEAGGGYGLVRRSRTRPLIAAVEGLALGGGMEVALACDLVVAATDARFALPEANRGLIANCGGLFRGAEKLPPNVALELLLTGDRLDATRAHALGFVNRLSAPGAAVATALAFAEAICQSSPQAVATVLRTLGQARMAREEPLWELSERAVAENMHSPDRRIQGVNATPLVVLGDE